MDTKLKSDIAESAVTTQLLQRGFNVLRPVGDRLAYDLAVENNGTFIRIQVKSAWYNVKDNVYTVDVRRTKTNRRRMLRKKYLNQDFELAIIYIEGKNLFYVIPSEVFNSFGSSISFVENEKRQRLPKSAQYKEKWDLIKRR